MPLEYCQTYYNGILFFKGFFRYSLCICINSCFLWLIYIPNVQAQQSSESEFRRDSLLAIEYFNIADTSFMNVDKCLHYTKMAIPLLQKTRQWEKYVYCLNCLSYCYNRKEEHDSMEINNVLALQEAERYLSYDNPYYIAAVNNLGVVYSRIKEDHQKALSLYKAALNQFHDDNIHNGILGTLLNNIGKEYQQMGDFDNAILYHKEALLNFRKAFEYFPEDFTNPYFKLAEVYSALAKLYEFKQDYATAKQYLGEELQLLNTYFQEYDANYFIYTYVNLAEISVKQDKLTDAAVYLEKALHFDSLTAAQKGKIFGTYAELYLKEGKFRKAADFNRKAIQYIPGEQSVEIAKALYREGKILGAQHQFIEAVGFLDRASLKLTPDSGDHGFDSLHQATRILSRIDFIDILHSKARMLESLYQQDGKAFFLEEALEVYFSISFLSDQIRQDYQTEESKLFLNKTIHRFYEDALSISYELFQITQDSKYIEYAFYFSEKSKAIALLEELLLKEAEGVFSIPAPLKEKFYQLRSEINYYTKLLDQAPAGEKDTGRVEIWNSRLLKARRDYGELNEDIAQKYPNYHHLIQPQIITVPQLQKELLHPKQLFIEYFVGEKKGYVFVIGKNKISFLKLQRIDVLESRITDLLQNLKMFGKTTDFPENAHLLFQQLIRPLSVTEEITHLVIVPDGALAFLPFEVLISNAGVVSKPKSLSFLLKIYNINYAYSGTVLNTQRKSELKRSSILAVAPVFENDPDKYLKCSQNEVKTFESFQSKTLLRQAASKNNFFSYWNKYEILHIASHATSSDTLLKQPAIDFWDGQLYLTDLYTFNTYPHLVVLSACETNVGELRAGEGVLSLARGFAFSGTPSLVTTLWKVNDKSTSTIIEAFYGFLEIGYTKDEALRAAKLQYIQHCTDSKAAPYYWASLLQLGDARPIKLRKKLFITPYIVISLLLLIYFCLYQIRNKS